MDLENPLHQVIHDLFAYTNTLNGPLVMSWGTQIISGGGFNCLLCSSKDAMLSLHFIN